MSAEDLERYEPRWKTPVVTGYTGTHILARRGLSGVPESLAIEIAPVLDLIDAVFLAHLHPRNGDVGAIQKRDRADDEQEKDEAEPHP